MNRTGMQTMLSQLEFYAESIIKAISEKEDALSTASDADYPNEERVSKLEEEHQLLEGMQSQIEELISTIADYINMA